MEAVVESVFLFVQVWPWLALAWIAFLGGSIGSFMNVVVYRMPRGMSLSHPSSHCPQCQHAIRWHDNLPVIGWLRLRGRCRDCRLPIPARYPTIEAAIALLFVAEWCRLDPASAINLIEFAWLLKPFVWNVVAVCVITCIVLIDHDADSPRQPNGLITFALFVAAALGLAAMVGVPIILGANSVNQGSPFRASPNMVGAVIGCAMAAVLNRIRPTLTAMNPPAFSIALTGLVGATIGPTSTVVVVVSSALLQAAALASGQRGSESPNLRQSSNRLKWSAIVLALTCIALWMGIGNPNDG